MGGGDNFDRETIEGFAREWTALDQSKLSSADRVQVFDKYFRIFPWDELASDAEGFDVGCGSGRWALLVAPRVGRLHCIDASATTIQVAQSNLQVIPNCSFHVASVDAMPLEDASMDFGYSLGVLHHVPDTAGAIRSCAAKLKPRAPLLLYLYYAFDNRPTWYRGLWKLSDLLRLTISRLPWKIKTGVSFAIATFVYMPLARTSAALERVGFGVESIPLSFYRHRSFYTMRTDALDRFGTRLEQRFTASQIEQMMHAAGLDDIRFSDESPYWCVVGRRAST